MTTTEDPTLAVSLHARRKLRYVPEFDGMRGLAAVFVVTVHLFMVVIPDEGGLPNEIPGTFVFMDMFFVLSGFLITALLLREQHELGGVGLLAFYRRRAMRLIPALWALLAVHWVYATIQGPPEYPADVERRSVLSAAFYGLNFQMDTLLSPVARGLTQLWSLAVEEQFYVVWPLVVILLLPVRRPLRVVVPVLVALIAAVFVHRFLLWDDSMTQSTGWLRLYTHTDTRADSLMVGALAAYLWVHRRVPTARALKVTASLSIPLLLWFLFFVELDDSFAYKGGFTLMAVAWASVIMAIMETDWWPRRGMTFRPLRTLGEVSYGIYLWHMPIQFWVIEHGGDWPVGVRVLASLVLTAVFVAASWYFIEKPFLRWKDRLDRREGATTPTTEPAPVAPPPAPLP
jgi:peptidoglycan/LPS O-acetylase OafA/YrhL